MDQLSSYFILEINQRRKRPFKGADRLFWDRVNRKMNEGRELETEEVNRLKVLYGRVSDPARLKW